MKKNIVFYYVDEWTILNENMKFKSNCLVLSNDFKTDFLNDIDENVHMIFLDKFKYFNFLKHRNSILPLVKFLHYIHSNEFSYKDYCTARHQTAKTLPIDILLSMQYDSHH